MSGVLKDSFHRLKKTSARGIIPIIIFVLGITTALALQQKYSIFFSPGVGDTLLYALDTSVQIQGKDLSGTEISLKTSASGEISFTIKRNIQDLVVMAFTTPGINVEAQTLEGPSSYTLRSLGDRAVQMSFDKRGSVQQIHNLAALNRNLIGNISLAQILRGCLPILPDSSVSLGETWTDKKRLDFLYQGLQLVVMMKMHHRLQNVISNGEGKEALFSSDYEITLSGSKEWGPWTASLEGEGTGSGMWSFQMLRSCIRGFSAESSADAALVLRAGNELFRRLPFRFEVSIALVTMN